jgi:integrase
MATITPRIKKDGTKSFIAQIRIVVDGIKHSEAKTGDDEKHLRKWAEAREAQLKRPGALAAMKSQGITVKQVLEYYMADFQGATAFGRSKLSHLKFLTGLDNFASLDAVKLTPAQLISHAVERCKTSKPQSVNNDFVWLSNAMKAVRLSRNLPLNIQAVADAMQLMRKEKLIGKSKRRDRRPTIDELNAILNYCKNQDGRARIPMFEIVLFAMFSARRQEEITKICWDDLDARRKGVLVREMKHPRSKQDTFVFMPPEAWAIAARQPRTEARIFPYNPTSISDTFRRICAVLGIADLHFHDLRHECCSWLFELGWEIPRVAGVSGHRAWATLQRYTHINHSEPHDKYAGWPFRPNYSPAGCLASTSNLSA